jgi:hypothetical protein
MIPGYRLHKHLGESNLALKISDIQLQIRLRFCMTNLKNTHLKLKTPPTMQDSLTLIKN